MMGDIERFTERIINPSKRSFNELLRRRRDSTAQFLPVHLSTNSPFAQAPSESLNRNFPPPSRLHRYEGDGFDFRRPIMNQQASPLHYFDSSDNIIDLTSDSESPKAEIPEVMNLDVQEIPQQGGRMVPARIPEVIDLLEDDDDDDNLGVSGGVSNQSPEVEFVEARSRIDHPRQLTRPTSPAFRSLARPTSWLGAGFVQYAGLMNRPHIGQMHNYTESILGRDTTNDHRQRDLYGFLNDMTSAIEPLIPGTDWLRGTGAIDFTQVGFDLQSPPREPTRPASSRYEVPKLPMKGFTRSPKEDDIIVCPSCDVELGTSKDPIQKQIWVIRQCGHTYCGACVNGRVGKKRILSKCICNGCASMIRSGRSCMFMLYI